MAQLYKRVANGVADIATQEEVAECIAEATINSKGALSALDKQVIDKVGNSEIQSIVTDYTLLLTDDNGKLKQVNGGSGDIVITIPNNEDVTYSTPVPMNFVKWGEGNVTFTPDIDVTIVSKDGALSIASQYGWASLIRIDIDVWLLYGDLV